MVQKGSQAKSDRADNLGPQSGHNCPSADFKKQRPPTLQSSARHQRILTLEVARAAIGQRPLIFIQVLVGDIIFGDLMGMRFPGVFIVGFLYPCHRAGLRDISLLHKLIDAF
jgi:hypothetical protein